MASRVIVQPPSSQFNANKGVLDIRVVQSATTGAGASVWALRCATAGKVLYVTKIWMQLSFSGTGAATEMIYEWIKGTACTAMTGGSAVTALLKKAGVVNTTDVDARVLDTGLTQTAISQGAAFCNVSWSRQTHSATQAGNIGDFMTFDFSNEPIELAANEVLSLRQFATSVIGDTVRGGVEFYGG